MRVVPRTPLLALAVLPLAACSGETPEGPYALAFDGGEDCVEVDVSGVTASDAWTVELWFRGDPGELDRPRPLLEWRGLFRLGAKVGGDTEFVVGSGEGITLGTTRMDGVLHHVAGTFDGARASLYVDGTLEAFADAAPDASPTPTLRVGCDDQAQTYAGLLDELRFSSVVRHDGDFDPPVAPYEVDADTRLLFHFDEGEGDGSLDAVDGVVARLYGPEWVPFDLAAGE